MKERNYFRECPNCGAHLDPGETCDCKAKAETAPVKIKTVEDIAGARSFENIVNPGDAVAEEIVYDFLCDLPPTTNRADLMQTGEPSDHRMDPRFGLVRSTYLTFQRRDGQWYFCGRCFEGDSESADKLAGATA